VPREYKYQSAFEYFQPFSIFSITILVKHAGINIAQQNVTMHKVVYSFDFVISIETFTIL
jgi:hypothetical protein